MLIDGNRHRYEPSLPRALAVQQVREYVRKGRSSLLMLDYDGTLAPFRVDRARALPYPGTREALGRLQARTSVRLVIITGRTVADIVPLLDMDPAPEIWGSHGWERRWPDGRYRVEPLDPRATEGLARAWAWTSSVGLGPRCERKAGSIALHRRGVPDRVAERLLSVASRGWTPLAGTYGLEIRGFDGGLELCAPGRSKADAVQTLLAESPPGIPAAYLGDDRTDEDAFEALGTRGLTILVRPEPRPSRACFWIRPPEQLLEFLEAWAQACAN